MFYEQMPLNKQSAGKVVLADVVVHNTVCLSILVIASVVSLQR